MYAPVYSRDGGLALTGHYKDFGSELKNSYFVKKGITERLLCQECDNSRIGSLDSYAKKIIEIIRNQSFDKPSIFINVNYTTFKLFELSILWRASICSHWMFEKIKLGSKHEEAVRKMLLLNKPGEPYEYGCVIQVPQNKNAKRIMIHSQMDRFKGHHRHLINTPGIHFEFYVSSHSKSIVFLPLFLQKNGKLPLIKTTETYDEQFLENVREMLGIVKG